MKKLKELCLQKAATAWCTKKNEKKTLDPDLAEAFADILYSELSSRKTKEAITKKLVNALRKDEGLYFAWQSNIAVQFQDASDTRKKYKGYLNRKDIHEISNMAAMSFLDLLIKKS